MKDLTIRDLIFAFIIIFLLVGAALTYKKNKDNYTEVIDIHLKEKERLDSILNKQDSVLLFLTFENRGFRRKNDSLKAELDTAFTRMEYLTRPVITYKDKKEALEWVNEYNSGLR